MKHATLYVDRTYNEKKLVIFNVAVDVFVLYR